MFRFWGWEGKDRQPCTEIRNVWVNKICFRYILFYLFGLPKTPLGRVAFNNKFGSNGHKHGIWDYGTGWLDQIKEIVWVY